ncbi:hypothetical protein WR25_06079 isoform B [Diploscapter pachys]|uniref:Sugar transporter SWEET n=2 Tax=Diploscapter pachys TaxID=2018661 RepID=A0A2A2LNN9_9BILA|nr:hypothetical protein WR25_06079 isoform B [Diploscapter pachys]
MGLIGGAFWLQYGFLKWDYVMITVNVVSVSLFMGYCIFFLVLASKKRTFAIHFGLVLISISAMLFWCNISPNIDHLGFICMMFNIINFGAPLAGLGVVLRSKNTSSLPLPMCIANLLVSSQWFLYGNCIKDPYIMAPNGVGMMLAVLQLSLFIVYPMKEQERSPLQKVTGLLGVGDVESSSQMTGSFTTTNSSWMSISSNRKLLRRHSTKTKTKVKKEKKPEPDSCKPRTTRSSSLSSAIINATQVRSRAQSVPEIWNVKEV